MKKPLNKEQMGKIKCLGGKLDKLLHMENIPVHVAIWRRKEMEVEMEGIRIAQHNLLTGRKIIKSWSHTFLRK